MNNPAAVPARGPTGGYIPSPRHRCALKILTAFIFSLMSCSNESPFEMDVGLGYKYLAEGGNSVMHVPGVARLYYGSRQAGGRLVWPNIYQTPIPFGELMLFQTRMIGVNLERPILLAIPKQGMPPVDISMPVIQLMAAKTGHKYDVDSLQFDILSIAAEKDGLTVTADARSSAQQYDWLESPLTLTEIKDAIARTKAEGVAKQYSDKYRDIWYITHR